MRLPCWPFEVEGQGLQPPTSEPVQEAAKEPPAPPTPTPPPVPPPVPPAVPVPVPVPHPPIPMPPPRSALPSSLPQNEEARYDIQYGILGSVGALSISVGGVTGAADGSEVINVHGAGEGAILGMGGTQRHIDAEFDPRALGSRRWTVIRLKSGQRLDEGTSDAATPGAGGAVILERHVPGQPPSRQTVTFAVPTSDPLGVLWRLRTAPPDVGQTTTLQLLDGQALWRVLVTTTAAGAPPPDSDLSAIRLEGELSPIFFDGRPDPDRPTRRFTLWLSGKTSHLPLRLEVPFGPSDIVMTLAEARIRKGRQPPDNPGVRSPAAPRPPSTTELGRRPDQVGTPVPGARSL